MKKGITVGLIAIGALFVLWRDIPLLDLQLASNNYFDNENCPNEDNGHPTFHTCEAILDSEIIHKHVSQEDHKQFLISLDQKLQRSDVRLVRAYPFQENGVHKLRVKTLKKKI